MGVINIGLMGSFGAPRQKLFSAQRKGHAAAVAEAIAYLAEVELPKAIVLDHECHNDNAEPTQGFAGSVHIKK